MPHASFGQKAMIEVPCVVGLTTPMMVQDCIVRLKIPHASQLNHNMSSAVIHRQITYIVWLSLASKDD